MAQIPLEGFYYSYLDLLYSVSITICSNHIEYSIFIEQKVFKVYDGSPPEGIYRIEVPQWIGIKRILLMISPLFTCIFSRSECKLNLNLSPFL